MNKAIAFVKENTWMSMSAMDRGWGNGYVALPPGHTFYGMDYDKIHCECAINVNGGLTFASKVEKWPELPEGCEDWWVIGFDTAHFGDTISTWPKEAVEQEAERLKEQVDKPEYYLGTKIKNFLDEKN